MSAEVATQIVATSQTVEMIEEQPFYIPMTGPAARPRRSLKHDDTFIVLDSHGDIGASAGGPDGLFKSGHRLSGAARACLRGHAAAAARHQSPRRQLVTHDRSHQSRHLSAGPAG